MIDLLYKKKIIRDFLSLFTENYWKQLITCILEYGIINFKKHHNIASLTPEDILSTVEILKKEENLVDKNKTNINIANKIKKNQPDISRSRSRSSSSTKDGSKIIKSNYLLKNVNLNTNTKTGRVSNISHIPTFSTEKNTKVNPKTNIKARVSQTPTREDNNKYGTFSDNKKYIDKVTSSKNIASRSKSNNKNHLTGKKNFVSANITSIRNIKTKNSFANDSDYESVLKSSRQDNSIIKKTTESEIPPEKKRKKPSEILEQIQLNKLKEKKSKNINRGSSKEKDVSNENVTDNELINSRKTSSSKLNKVESKLKNVIANDKKIYNMMKNNINTNCEDNDINIMTLNEENLKPKLSETKSYATLNKEKFIGDGFSSNGNNAKKSILSLEERLNGLTQKISNVEKSSYKYNDFIDEATESTSIPVRSYNLSVTTNKNNQISYANNYDNFTKNPPYKTSPHNIQDEDYLAEDHIDLNKYNYLYNNVNKTEEYGENEGYDIGNHNYDDLEEE